MAQGDTFPAAYLDFEKAQAAHSLTTPTGFIADGSPKRRHIWSRFFRGEGMGVKKIQYGKNIEYSTILSQRSSGETYSPGAVSAPTNTQHGVKGTAYWRFIRWNKMYNKKELQFNGQEPLTHQFVNLWAEKQAYLEQDVNDFMEDRFFAVPYSASMEGSGDAALEPFSVFAHINGDVSGLFGSTFWTGFAWTTKQGLTPGTAAYGDNMKPQTQTYDNFTWASDVGIFSSMHGMVQKMYWEMPETLNTYWESDNMNKQVILTSMSGHRKAISSMQSASCGDLFLHGKQDPASPDPQFFGIPITWNDTFGAAAVYDNGSAGLATEAAANITGPRYMFINGNYIVPVVSADNQFAQDEPLRDSNRPDTFVIYVTLDYNLVCTSYKRQGMLSPRIDVGV